MKKWQIINPLIKRQEFLKAEKKMTKTSITILYEYTRNDEEMILLDMCIKGINCHKLKLLVEDNLNLFKAKKICCNWEFLNKDCIINQVDQKESKKCFRCDSSQHLTSFLECRARQFINVSVKNVINETTTLKSVSHFCENQN
ncbi:hypothetical protein A3Q56_08552 [Intoshia linei]|uniref:Uncharacterized protein n=1 Tax=Intoshia linei TaxID=1819745 RepID=A0A177APJ9_9BILA|nr:hypothetical protein A3Q56_08552 [Intoshia linei]